MEENYQTFTHLLMERLGRVGINIICCLLIKKNISALYVGGVKQPNSGATPLDITVKVKFDISHMLQISLIYNLFYSEYKYI